MNRICRFCLKTLSPGLGKFLLEKGQKTGLASKIQRCTSLTVSGVDGLPHQMCRGCYLQLELSFQFVNQCVEADRLLRKALNRSATRPEQQKSYDGSRQVGNSTSGEFMVQYKNMPCGKNREIRLVHKDTGLPIHRKKVEQNKVVWNASQDVGVGEDTETRTPSVSVEQNKVVWNASQDIGVGEDSETRTPSVSLKQNKVVWDASQDVGVDEKKETRTPLFSVEQNKVVWDASQDVGVGEDTETRTPSVSIYRDLISETTSSPWIANTSMFTCKHCQKVYPSISGWRYHVYTVHSKTTNPFNCETCGKSFLVKRSLQAHTRSVHLRIKPHLCDWCGNSFSEKGALKKHQAWHMGEKNLACDVCGKTFLHSCKLNEHRKIHGEPKAVLCEICSRSFRRKRTFEIHMRTHTGEKPYECGLCGKAFSSKTNMRTHEKSHQRSGGSY